MSIDDHKNRTDRDRVDPAAVTRVLQKLRGSAPERADGCERFLLADPDDARIHVFEFPPDGPIRRVETVATSDADATPSDDDPAERG